MCFLLKVHNCREIPGIALLFVYFTLLSLHRAQVKIHALPLLLVRFVFICCLVDMHTSGQQQSRQHGCHTLRKGQGATCWYGYMSTRHRVECGGL